MVQDSHPGYPWCKLGRDNGTVLTSNGDLIWTEVAKRFNSWLEHGKDIFTYTPEQLVKFGICDTVKVFIKKEPHSLKKIAEGRLRIISSVSLVDQIMTRLLCKKQNAAEIENWMSCPSSPGMGLNDDGLKVIWDIAKRMSLVNPICETDVSGWDWSVQQWELDLDADIRAELMGANPLMGFFLKVHAYVVGHSVFTMPDGDMFAQTIPGGQLSGDYNTSSTNSRCRVIATIASRIQAKEKGFLDTLGETWPSLGIKAMGDDSFEVWFRGLEDGLSAIGHSIKMCVVRNANLDGLEFCSQKFVGEGIAYPVDPTKTLFRFLSHNPADQNYLDYKVQLMDYFRHLPSEIKSVYERLASARVERAQNLADRVVSISSNGQETPSEKEDSVYTSGRV